MVQKQLEMLQGTVTIRHLALDGHFGNNNALQLVLQCCLHLISKLRCDSALHFRYDGLQKKKGPRRKHGQKIDYRNISNRYLVEKSPDGDIETRFYQASMLHREFAQPLNMVIITKTNLKTGAFAKINLFSSDWNSPGRKSLTITACGFRLSSISEMPNNIGAWKIS
jgi:putative transposase